MIACNKGVVESRTIHWDMSESVFGEVLLEASQQEVVGEVGGEIKGWHHLRSDEGEVMGKTHTVAGDIPANDLMSKS
jgi:hypothetical protein